MDLIMNEDHAQGQLVAVQGLDLDQGPGQDHIQVQDRVQDQGQNQDQDHVQGQNQDLDHDQGHQLVLDLVHRLGQGQDLLTTQGGQRVGVQVKGHQDILEVRLDQHLALQPLEVEMNRIEILCSGFLHGN